MTLYSEVQPEMVVADREVYREAARILPRLAKDGAYVRPLSSSPGRQSGEYGLFNRRNNFTKPVMRFRGAIAIGLQRHGLLKEQDGKWSISSEGTMWLRRRNAGAAPFAEQHQDRRTGLREVNNVSRPVVINEVESPLGWLHRRKDKNGQPLISGAQYQAGERLRADYERGQLMPRTTSNWGGLAPSRRQKRAAPEGAAGLNDAALDARNRVSQALSEVGPELSGVLVDVCCHLMGLSDTERNYGWPQRSGKVILQIALSRLARHYGLERADERNARSSHIAHWGVDGYRPSLEKWE